jgi:hypothetical protein
MTSQTISEEQKRLNKELHSTRPDFGSLGGAGHHGVITAIRRYKELNAIESVLDYGTGKGIFPKSLKGEIPELIVGAYDPAVEAFSVKPNRTFDLVTSFDVLEHVERKSVPAVLNEISEMSNKLVYLQIDLQPAVKRLSSGRNAHIMLAPSDWWISEVSSVFPTLGTFPIYHETGAIQKVAIVASKKPFLGSLVWSLLSKLQSNPMIIKSGYLGTIVKKKKKP